MPPKTPAKAASPSTVKMIRPEDLQPQPCVVEVPDSRIDEFKAEGWVVKSDAEIDEMLQARAPKPEAQPEVQVQAQAQETAPAAQGASEA
jgi:hypothetical protein